MKKSNREEFIEKAKQVHGDDYVYTDVNYINSKTKVCIICREHGPFLISPNHHLKGSGCPICAKRKRNKHNLALAKSAAEKFIIEANVVHDNFYDYNKAEYINSKVKLCVTCPIHGDFWITPNNHLTQKQGCPICGKEKAAQANKNRSISFEEFLQKAKTVHNDDYIYDNRDWLNLTTKIKITCPTHGPFVQEPHAHIKGQGCPKCASSRLEKAIINFLNDKQISYIHQWKHPNLGRKSVDFYLPDYDIAIECQGGQHFQPIEYFGGKENFIKTIQNDEDKFQTLSKMGVEVIYYTTESYIPQEFKEKHNYLKSIDELANVLTAKIPSN